MPEPRELLRFAVVGLAAYGVTLLGDYSLKLTVCREKPVTALFFATDPALWPAIRRRGRLARGTEPGFAGFGVPPHRQRAASTTAAGFKCPG
jgi:hypothetical protein